MSHVIEYGEYEDCKVKTKKQRAEIQSYWDNVAAIADRGEGCTGLDKPIDWRDDLEPFATKEEAEEFIEHLSQGWYVQVAVKFYKECVPSQRLIKIKNEIENLRYQFNNENAYYVRNPVKSKFLSCRHCGTKIALERFLNRKFINLNLCPVCEGDLRPKTELVRLEKVKEKLAKLEEKYKEAQAKENRRNKKVAWLVKVEWHE